MKKRRILVSIAVIASAILLMMPVALAGGPDTGEPGHELQDDTTVSCAIKQTLITSITPSVDFGEIPAGTATEKLLAISANVRGNVTYSMDVHGLADFSDGGTPPNTMPIGSLAIKGGDIGWTAMTLTSRGINILLNKAVPGSDAGTTWQYDLKMTPPSQTPAATYNATLRFTTYH